jgi:hypothetical protein
MRYSPAALGGVALALLCAAAPGARADFIPWNYAWSRSPDKVLADSPGTGFISLTDEPTKSAAGTSDIVATNIQTHSTAPNDNPDLFTAKPFTLSLSLQDQLSGSSGTLDFTGQFDGTLTANSALIRGTFTGPLTQTLVLGGNVYTVTIGQYTAPAPPGASNSGSIGAHAEVLVQPGPVEANPEPRSLILSGLALPGIGLMLWRQRFGRRL